MLAVVRQGGGDPLRQIGVGAAHRLVQGDQIVLGGDRTDQDHQLGIERGGAAGARPQPPSAGKTIPAVPPSTARRDTVLASGKRVSQTSWGATPGMA
ncbi:hypothetical protein [Actinomadura keratinilytica]|uniref:hypothetical protein n=1 Tax=Actinomadura keratinilytica TaxID=547461 RepID=UPI0036160F40